MRLPNSEHTSRPWRIHEIAHDFRLEDVWALPTPGGPDDFPRLVNQAAGFDPFDNPSPVYRGLFSLRLKLGELLGLDDPRDAGPSAKAPTLADRVPEELRRSPGPDFENVPFRSLYLRDDEWAAELANKTVHGVLHMAWVEDEKTGGYRGQMAVLVKPSGLLGKAYMAAIKPFRYTIVYPQLLKSIERAWEKGAPASAPGGERLDTAAPVR